MVIAKENLTVLGVRASADRDPMSGEGFPHPESLPTEADEASVTDFAGRIIGSILDRWKSLRQFDGTRLVAAGRSGHIQALVGAHGMAAAPPVGHLLLRLMLIGEALKAQQLHIQGPIKAFVFAFTLRMTRPGVANPYIQAHQPASQLGIMRAAVRKTLRGTPRGAIVTQDRLGQPVAAKDCLQVAFNGRPALIRAGLG